MTLPFERLRRQGEATGVQNDKFNVVDGGLLDPVDEFMFGVALEAIEVVSEFFGNLNATLFDVGKPGRAVDIGFT